MPEPDQFLIDLLLIVASGLLASVVCRRLGVSAILGYLAIGALLGGGALGWVGRDRHEVELIAEAGVFLLLFSVGLEFSIGELRSLAWRLPVGGATQMGLVALPAALVCKSLGLSWPAAALMAAAVSFSSTVLVFKTLAELGQSSTPHGRRAIGILLFQDVALVPLLLLVPLLTTGTGQSAGELAWLAAKTIGFVVAVIAARRLLGEVVVPQLAAYRSPELVVLLTVVVLGLATLGAAYAGLPPALGALAAGLCFGGNRWSAQVDALVLPFREVFAVVFFVGLGLLVDVGVLLRSPLTLVGMAAALILLKAAAGAVAVLATGLSRRASVGVGLGLAHVGEFAFVLAEVARRAGLVSDDAHSAFSVIAFLTLLLTPVLLRAGLKLTGMQGEAPAEGGGRRPAEQVEHAVIVGAGPVGTQLASHLETRGVDVTVIDRSPMNLYPFSQAGMKTLAGDGSEPSTLQTAGADHASLIVVAVSSDEAAERIVRQARRLNPSTQMIVRCRFESRTRKLAALGADVVVSEEREAYTRLLAELERDSE
ncbi:MAG: cation:proton antiporter [Planctomycetota bacterium]